ncbi:MAG: creatininase family protein [Eubacteriales bacterium]|nr:creatininase family protein [Eubacteriales bacterium]
MLRRLQNLTWKALDALNREQAIYLLPISSNEQHGWHLPVGTDDLILEAALNALESRTDLPGELLRMPSQHYGNSHEHLDYAGTISLRCGTLAQIVENMLECMQIHDFRRLVIVNSHGGNTALLQAYAQEWEQRYHIGLYTVNFWVSDFFTDAQSMLQTPLSNDIHAGELETSLMMYLYPQLVADAFATPENDVATTLSEYHSGWSTQQLSPRSGTLGNASLATAQKGEQLFRYLCDKLAAILREIGNTGG